MIEEIVEDDAVLSRDEHNPFGVVSLKRVEKVFKRAGLVMTLAVGGREIKITHEHPVFAKDRGWVNAADLHVGDQLSSDDGQWQTLDAIVDSGSFEV